MFSLPQSACSADSPAGPAPLLPALRTFSPLTGKSALIRGGLGRCRARGRLWVRGWTGGFCAASQRHLISQKSDRFLTASPQGEALGAEEGGCTVEEREVFTLLRSDPSSVTAFAVPPSPQGEGKGRCRARGRLWARRKAERWRALSERPYIHAGGAVEKDDYPSVSFADSSPDSSPDKGSLGALPRRREALGAGVDGRFLRCFAATPHPSAALTPNELWSDRHWRSTYLYSLRSATPPRGRLWALPRQSGSTVG